MIRVLKRLKEEVRDKTRSRSVNVYCVVQKF